MAGTPTRPERRSRLRGVCCGAASERVLWLSGPSMRDHLTARSVKASPNSSSPSVVGTRDAKRLTSPATGSASTEDSPTHCRAGIQTPRLRTGSKPGSSVTFYVPMADVLGDHRRNPRGDRRDERRPARHARPWDRQDRTQRGTNLSQLRAEQPEVSDKGCASPCWTDSRH